MNGASCTTLSSGAARTSRRRPEGQGLAPLTAVATDTIDTIDTIDT